MERLKERILLPVMLVVIFYSAGLLLNDAGSSSGDSNPVHTPTTLGNSVRAQAGSLASQPAYGRRSSPELSATEFANPKLTNLPSSLRILSGSTPRHHAQALTLASPLLKTPTPNSSGNISQVPSTLTKLNDVSLDQVDDLERAPLVEPHAKTNSPAIPWSELDRFEIQPEDLISFPAASSNTNQPALEPIADLKATPRVRSVDSENSRRNGVTRTNAPKPDSDLSLKAETINWSPMTVQNYQKKVAYAVSMARRGAYSTAKSELIDALFSLSVALDDAHGNTRFTQAHREAMTAISESEDFTNQINMRTSTVLAGHATRLNPELHAQLKTANQYQTAYLHLAETKLRDSVANTAIASSALRAMGKVFAAEQSVERGSSNDYAAKAVLCFGLASSLDSSDAESANLLGVIYARLNYLDQARDTLVESLRRNPSSQAWRNLASVHQKRNELELAQMARGEAVRAAEFKTATRSPLVQWTSPSQFARVSGMVEPPAATHANQVSPQYQQANRAGRGFQNPYQRPQSQSYQNRTATIQNQPVQHPQSQIRFR